MINVNKLFKIAKPRSERALRLAQKRKRMRLENIKENIDSKIDSMLPKELYTALKECGIPEQLKVGDKFQQTFNNGLIFEILDIKPERNWCKVIVINPLNHFQHIEDWGDLHTVYQALSIGEYKMI